jgi:protein-L-isoaspartate O-methyltransferase
VQRLLAVLAVGRRCAETGTAFGEGAAAIASTAHSLVTVESDAERAQAAAERLRARPGGLFVKDDLTPGRLGLTRCATSCSLIRSWWPSKR